MQSKTSTRKYLSVRWMSTLLSTLLSQKVSSRPDATRNYDDHVDTFGGTNGIFDGDAPYRETITRNRFLLRMAIERILNVQLAPHYFDKRHSREANINRSTTRAFDVLGRDLSEED